MGRIKLPRGKALPCGPWEKVVVVVPALPEGDNRDEPIIPALIPGFIFLFSKHVGERIYGESGMVEQDGGYKKSPGEHG